MQPILDQNRCTSLNAEVPAGFCRKLVKALATVKLQLRDKFERALPGRRDLVRDLLADAEALAWETSFPHLLLPDIAELRMAEVLANQPSSRARLA